MQLICLSRSRAGENNVKANQLVYMLFSESDTSCSTFLNQVDIPNGESNPCFERLRNFPARGDKRRKLHTSFGVGEECTCDVNR